LGGSALVCDNQLRKRNYNTAVFRLLKLLRLLLLLLGQNLMLLLLRLLLTLLLLLLLGQRCHDSVRKGSS
jgi:hypothetical protein